MTFDIRINMATSCLGCGKFIERIHPDYAGIIAHPTEGRLILGCFTCREVFMAKLEATLAKNDR